MNTVATLREITALKEKYIPIVFRARIAAEIQRGACEVEQLHSDLRETENQARILHETLGCVSETIYRLERRVERLHRWVDNRHDHFQRCVKRYEDALDDYENFDSPWEALERAEACARSLPQLDGLFYDAQVDYDHRRDKSHERHLTDMESMELLEVYLELTEGVVVKEPTRHCIDFISAVVEFWHKMREWRPLRENLCRCDLLKDDAERQLTKARSAWTRASSISNVHDEHFKQTRWELQGMKKTLSSVRKHAWERTKWPCRLRRTREEESLYSMSVAKLVSLRMRQQHFLKQLPHALAEQHAAREQHRTEVLRLAHGKADLDKLLDPMTWWTPRGLPWWKSSPLRFYTVGARCQARPKGWSRWFTGTIISVNGHKVDIDFDDEESHFGIDAHDVRILFPKRLSMKEVGDLSGEILGVSSFFHPPSEEAYPLNMVFPKLQCAVERQRAIVEDVASRCLRADARVSIAAASILQLWVQWIFQRRRLRRLNSSLAGRSDRVFKSRNMYTFRKYRKRAMRTNSMFIRRDGAILIMQRNVRRLLSQTLADALREQNRLEAIAREEKREARRREVEFANRLRKVENEQNFVSTWRCPRCPPSKAYAARFHSLEEIQAHKLEHVLADADKQKSIRERMRARERQKEAKLEEWRQRRAATLDKFERAKVEALIKAAEEKARKEIVAKQKLIKRQLQVFNFKYAPNHSELNRALLRPPYPTLRLVKDYRHHSSVYHKMPLLIDIKHSPFTIGRSTRCDMTVDSKARPGMVSKMHCCIYVVGERVLVADVHSTNGTFVNMKRRIHPTSGSMEHATALNDGDMLTLGCIVSPSSSLPSQQQQQKILPSSVSYILYRRGRVDAGLV
eukprot:g1462.t1